MPTPEESPADHLEGLLLRSGWLVGEKIGRHIGATGANFGVGYTATRDGQKAFLKAVDFREAFKAPDLLAAVASLANEMQWEKQVLDFCAAHRMSKVVRIRDHEYVEVPGCEGDPTKRVSCLVLEIGEAGDLRKALNEADPKTDSWKLFALREVSLGLDQLHRRGAAHLDVKPSNVILLGDTAGVPEAKLGDLARVVMKTVAGPFDGLSWPGDWNYRPPEKWYGFQSPDWNDERETGDAFLLGSLMIFLFTGSPMSTLLHNKVPEEFRQPPYRGKFDDALIDVLVRAQTQVLQTYLRPELPVQFREELLEIARELTHPDPRKRGDKRARQSGVVGIDRFHPKFYRMAQRLSLEERRKHK